MCMFHLTCVETNSVFTVAIAMQLNASYLSAIVFVFSLSRGSPNNLS